MAIDAAEIIDKQIFGSFHVRIMVLCGLVQFFEGFDALVLAYTAPSLTHAWHIQRSALGPVFAASLMGMAIGTVTLSPLADWIGRKKLIILAVFIFGSLTLVATQVKTLDELRILRFLMGFGLAAAVPSTVVLVNEFAPRKHRAAMVMGMSIGVAVGAACGGQLTAVLIPHFGWQGAFYVGGIAPLALLFALFFWLPESVRFLTVKGRPVSEIVAILRKLDPALIFPADVQFTLHQKVQPKNVRLSELFMRGRAVTTLLLWAAFVVSLIVLNFLNNWLPTVLADTGLRPMQALRITTLFQFGGIVGIVCMGFLCDRFGYFRVLIIAFTMEVAFITVIGWSSGSVPLLVMAVPLVGMCIIGSNNALTALAASLYPTRVRATGTSLAHAFGRFGGVLGPIIGGILLEMHWSLQKVFAFGAVFPVCGIMLMVAMALRESRGEPRDQRDMKPRMPIHLQ
jgi:AAHS family 4-hydroxybenzoate transporter-like MFS transporter